MKRDWNSRTILLLVGAILVVLNLVGLNLFFRLDFTDDKVYSLSDASIELVQSLEDPITLKAFFTEDLPAPYSSNRRFLKDKLDDYRAYGGQTVQYEFIDPIGDEDLSAEAARYQIPPVQIQVVENDEVQIKNAYMGLGILYAGEREVIPLVQNMATLEYDITSAIKKLTRDRTPIVGFLSGHGEPDLQQNMAMLSQTLQRNYDVQSVTAANGTLTPRPDVLMVVAPADSVPDADLQAINTFIMEGGKAAFLLNRVNANLQFGQATAFSTGLEGLLQNYGINIQENLVQDQQSSAVSMQRMMGGFPVIQRIEYPFFPIATNFNLDNAMVNRMRNVMFYFTSSIDTSGVAAGVTVEPLVLSTPNSATQQGFFMIQPMPTPQPLSGGPFVLGAAYSGSFPNAYAEGQSVDTRIVAFGDGDLFNEAVLGQGQVPPGNIELGLNMVDWLAQDEALLTIRSKTIEPRQLDPVPEGSRAFIKYGTMMGPMLLIVLFGLVRWRARKARQIVWVRSQG